MWFNKKKQLPENDLQSQLAALEKAYKILSDIRAPLASTNIAHWTFLYHAGLYVQAQAEDVFDRVYRMAPEEIINEKVKK